MWRADSGRRSQPALPAGVELYPLATGNAAARSGGPFLRFIDDGQLARYLIGDPATSPGRPSNATVKLGVVRPHSAFTPHAHGGEHFVLSLGYAACGVYDEQRQEVAQVRLPPATMIRIPAMVPHSFANRAGRPLLILAANTGFGLDHEDYAITAAQAERRAGDRDSTDVDYPALAKALRAIEQAPSAGMSWREHLAARLRRLATGLEPSP